jgi:hypothetical protein
MNRLFAAFLPANTTPLALARARVLVAACLAVGAAILALLLYWIAFSWLEQTETVFAGLVLIALLAGILALVRRGNVGAAAWILTVLVLLLNLANMLDYGIGTTSSAGFVLAILLAAFTIGPAMGLAAAALGSVAAFAITLAASTGLLMTEIPFQQSNLSFDAVALTLIYLLVGILCAAWSPSAA